MIKYYSLHDLVTLRTNINLSIPSYFRVNRIKDPDIDFIQEEFYEDSDNKIRTRNFYYWIEGKELNIDYEFPFINARAVIQDLGGKPKIHVTKSFSKYSRVGIPIRPIIQLKLIQRGYTLIHAGCLNYNGESILVVAPRDTGKTSTILNLLNSINLMFMSDDLTIISDTQIAYSYPELIDVSPHTLTGDFIEPYNSNLGKFYIPTLLLGRLFNIELTQKREIPSGLMGDKGKISKVFILTGGKEEAVKEIGIEESVRKIFISTTDLINPMKEYLLNLYSYACDFPILDKVVRQYSIIENAIWNAKCFEICTSNVKDYSVIIKKMIVE